MSLPRSEPSPLPAHRVLLRVVALTLAMLCCVVPGAALAAASGYPPSISGTPYAGQVGQAYGFGFQVDGDPAPTVSLVDGDLPPGLGLSADGVLSGTPRAAGSYAFTVAASNGADTDATEAVTVRIDPGDDPTAPPSLRGTPPDAVAGQPYGFGFTVDGDPSPTVTLVSGTLPPGLTLSPDGVLGGTPTQPGQFAFSVSADNGVPPVATRSVTMSVAAGPTSPPSISGTPPDATAGVAYAFAFSLDGEPDPTTTLAAGALPPGLSLSSDGTVSGTPQTAGSFDFTVRASNGQDPDALRPVTLVVAPDPQAVRFTSPAPTDAAAGGTYTPTAVGNGSSSPVVITPSTDTQGVCTIDDAGVVHFLRAGTCTLVATQAGDDDHPDGTPARQTFRVANGKVAQTIAFTSAPPSPAAPGQSYDPTVRGGGSTAPVVFSRKPSSARVCTVSAAGHVELLAPGRCVIYASQAGDASYRPAPRISQVVVVGRR